MLGYLAIKGVMFLQNDADFSFISLAFTFNKGLYTINYSYQQQFFLFIRFYIILEENYISKINLLKNSFAYCRVNIFEK